MFDFDYMTAKMEDGSIPGLPLPDRMFNPGLASRLWTLVFTNRKRLKEVSDRLSKSRIISKLPRKLARSLDPEMVVSGLLMTRDMRVDIFRQDGIFEYSEWANIVLGVHARLQKKLPTISDPKSAIGLDLSDYAINYNSEDSYDREYLAALACYTNREAYQGLLTDEKDLADFVVNVMLGEIADYDLIIDFLDKFPWLKSRNTKFYDCAVRDLEQESEDEEESDEDFIEGEFAPAHASFAGFLLQHGARVMSFATFGDSPSLPKLVEIGMAIDALLNEETFGVKKQLVRAITDERDRFSGFVSKVAGQATSVASLKDMPVWAQCRELVEQMDKEIILRTIDSETLDLAGRYCKQVEDNHLVMQDYPQRFSKALETFKLLKAEVAKEATRDDTDVEVLLKKSEDFRASSLVLNETSAQAGQVFVDVLTTFIDMQKHLDDLSSAAIAPPEVVTPMLPAPEVSTGPEEGDQAIEQVTAFNKALKEKLTQANARISELEKQQKTQTETFEEKAKANQKAADEKARVKIKALEEHIKNLKAEAEESRRENYSLKQRLEYDPVKAVEKPESMQVDKDVMMALITQNRSPNPEEILEFFQALAPDRLVVLPFAMESARAAFDFCLPYRLTSLLHKLVYDYLDAINGGKPDSEARKIFGNGYAAKESEGVSSSSRLRAMREFKVNGEIIFFTQHLAIGRNFGTKNSLRIYFKIIDQKIVIAHCGEHFETMQTN